MKWLTVVRHVCWKQVPDGILPSVLWKSHWCYVVIYQIYWCVLRPVPPVWFPGITNWQFRYFSAAEEKEDSGIVFLHHFLGEDLHLLGQVVSSSSTSTISTEFWWVWLLAGGSGKYLQLPEAPCGFSHSCRINIFMNKCSDCIWFLKKSDTHSECPEKTIAELLLFWRLCNCILWPFMWYTCVCVLFESNRCTF